MELPLHNLCWGSTKTAVLNFQENKAVLTYSLLIFLSVIFGWALKIMMHPQHFSLEEISLPCIFITHLSVFLPSFLAQYTWCKGITWFFNSVEAGGTASSSGLEVSTWPVGKGGVKGKDDRWYLHVVMIWVCWMWNDLGYNFRNTVNLWKRFSGKNLPQSWHRERFALLLNVTLSVSYSLGHSAAGSVKWQLRTFQREIQTLASQCIDQDHIKEITIGIDLVS